MAKGAGHEKSPTLLKQLQFRVTFFARYGLCNELVSDDGNQITFEEFARFCKNSGEKHIRSPLGHPQLNGQADWDVNTVKNAIKKGLESGETLEAALRKFLAQYRTISHSTTGTSPFEMFLNREMKTLLDLLKPSAVARVSDMSAFFRHFVPD